LKSFLTFGFWASFDIWILEFGISLVAFGFMKEVSKMRISKFKQLLRDERGAVLAIALLIMIALALIGAAAMITSTMELDIARNERLAKESFYMADGGTSLAPIIIEEAAETRALPNIAGIEIKDNNLMSELMGYTTNNDKDTDNSNNNPDIYTEVNNKDINIDVDRIATQILAGGAAEFAGGYEGIGGGGASGGIAIFYRVDSQGSSAGTSRALIETYYRKVVNIAGE
jgi:Tfp pilus assembly protein PilX